MRCSGKKEMAISMVLGLVLGVVLFIVAPAFITNLLVGEYDAHTLAWNIVDGLLRVAVFVFYIWLIGRMEDIKRMFGYHGAEHKTIHCYEHGLPLTPENARQFPRLHVRCGTAFLIMVMIIAIFVYTVIPLNALISAWGVPDGAPEARARHCGAHRADAGYRRHLLRDHREVGGSHPENPLVKVVLWPGMQMQYLTTNEPDDGMLECAIAAMQRCSTARSRGGEGRCRCQGRSSIGGAGFHKRKGGRLARESQAALCMLGDAKGGRRQRTGQVTGSPDRKVASGNLELGTSGFDPKALALDQGFGL